MSHHSSDYESASADLVEYFGQPILYYDPSLEDSVEIDAIVHPERTERRELAEGGWNRVQLREIFFDADDADVKMNGTITIGSDEYSIDATGTAEGNRTWVRIKRTLAGEISRPRARR